MAMEAIQKVTQTEEEARQRRDAAQAESKQKLAAAQKAAQRLRQILAKFAEVELLVQIGEYKKGADKEADDALAHIDKVNAFLKQGLGEKSTFEQTLEGLFEAVR